LYKRDALEKEKEKEKVKVKVIKEKMNLNTFLVVIITKNEYILFKQ
jgi:hypothetical protein